MLNPFFMMLVLNFVFSNLFKSDIENFPVYLMCGQLIFNFFSEATNLAMVSIVNNSGLIKKVYIPKYIFPLSTVISTFVNLLFSMVALLVIMLATKVSISLGTLTFIIPLVYVLIISVGIGLILASYSVFFRDLLHLYNVFTMALMYMTPIFYPISIIPDEFRSILKFNPMYYIISCFRSSILQGTIGPIENHIISLSTSIVFLILGIVVFLRKQDKFILYI